MQEQVDLLLINPGAREWMYGELGPSLSSVEPPLWCALTAAFIREHGFTVKVLDADAENLSPDGTVSRVMEYNPLLAGLVVLGANPSASSTPKMTVAGKIARILKEKAPHIRNFLSGIHPSALPERTLKEEHADFVCQGEGFYTIRQLLEAIKSGKDPRRSEIPGLCYLQSNRLISNPLAPLVNLDDLPFAAWDLLPMDKYRAHNWHCFDHLDRRQPYAVTYTSFGCPFHCHYCNIHALYNGKPGIRYRSPEKVVAEIDFLVKNYKIRNLKIFDELFAISENRVIRICDLLIEGGYDLNMWSYARADTITERMLQKMKQAGINWVGFGIESASSEVRKSVDKKLGQDAIMKALEITRAAGIYIMGNFIFGLPEDSLETMQQTLDMAKEFNFEYVNFYTAMAYPGSPLYEDAVKKGIKLPEKWHGYAQYSDETLPLPTRYLSAGEVLRFRDRAFREYFSNPEYIDMIGKKFGPEVVEHIKTLAREIHRKVI